MHPAVLPPRARGRRRPGGAQAEQSAQLAVKALLHGVVEGGWGHDLVELGQVWSTALGADLGDGLEASLQAHAVRRRGSRKGR
ncbi:MAG TPA: hypothetical protein VK988_16375 [Acidimicrobiales bacterium]|nr:hypothetical protein [Acidimicrobiales bacterium]